MKYLFIAIKGFETDGHKYIDSAIKNGAVANCTITVKKMATVVLLNKTSLSLDVGKTYTLTTSIPSSTAAYYKTFTSSDTSVATVNSSGVVTGKGAGRATITVKLNSFFCLP